MKHHGSLKSRMLYWAIRLTAFVLQLFPIDWNLKTARLFGRVWWRFDRRHRVLTLDHLRAAYGGELSEDEVERIGRASFQHWSMYAVEFFCAMHLLNEWTWPRYIEFDELRDLMELLMAGDGAILVTGHYGNFELTAFMLAAVGFDVVAVMRPLDNPYLNAYLVRTRGQKGLKLLDKFGATAEAETILEQGGALGFVADQDAGRKGVFVDFFRQPASTYKSIALLAMSTNKSIVVGCARRTGGRFHYRVEVSRIIRPEEWCDRDDPLQWITQTYASAIEASVRECPEQYLWMHRRWKSKPKVGRTRGGVGLRREGQDVSGRVE